MLSFCIPLAEMPLAMTSVSFFVFAGEYYSLLGPPLGPQVLPGQIAVCPLLLGDQHQIFHSGGSLKKCVSVESIDSKNIYRNS